MRVGLGVDGSASNERSDLFFEVKQALLVARGRGGSGALTAREALALATRGGASVLRRDDIGSLEPGKRADLAIWRTDGLEFGGAEDLVANLVLSGPHRVDRLVVGGEDVVRGGSLVRAREQEIARRAPQRGEQVVAAMSLSTHVLDTERGAPAAGVRVELYGPDGVLAGEGTTDADGRIARLAETAPGSYRLVFHPPSPFFTRVELQISTRRRPRARSASHLLLRMRELPRQLSAEQLAELFEGRTRFVEQLATLEDPLGRARELARAR